MIKHTKNNIYSYENHNNKFVASVQFDIFNNRYVSTLQGGEFSNLHGYGKDVEQSLVVLNISIMLKRQTTYKCFNIPQQK